MPERFAKPRFVHAAPAIKVDRPSTRASRWSSRLERLRKDPGPRLIDIQAGRLSATSSQSIPRMKRGLNIHRAFAKTLQTRPPCRNSRRENANLREETVAGPTATNDPQRGAA